MEQYKREFIDFMIECDVLTFGDFVTKSGRPTPYFVQTGKYRTGGQIRRLGEFYADAIEAKFKNSKTVLIPLHLHVYERHLGGVSKHLNRQM